MSHVTEEQEIALGAQPRTLRGWWFWLRHWSPPVLWLRRRRLIQAGKASNAAAVRASLEMFELPPDYPDRVPTRPEDERTGEG